MHGVVNLTREFSDYLGGVVLMRTRGLAYMMNGIIDRIRSRDEPLADALAKLVKQYRFDTLQELFEELNH